MKTFLCLLTAALLCGCNKPDAKVNKLEARILSLETNLAQVTIRLNFQRDFQDSLFLTVSNMFAADGEVFKSIETAIEQQGNQIGRLSRAVTNHILESSSKPAN